MRSLIRIRAAGVLLVLSEAALAAEPPKVVRSGGEISVQTAAGPRLSTRLSTDAPLELLVTGPGNLRLEARRLLAGAVADPQAFVTVQVDGKPFKAFKLPLATSTDVVVGTGQAAAKPGLVEVPVPDGSHRVVLLWRGGDAAAVVFSFVSGPVAAAPTPGGTATPAPIAVAPTPTPSPVPAAGRAMSSSSPGAAGDPLAPVQTLIRRRPLRIGFSLGYLYSGADLAGPVGSVTATHRPFRGDLTGRIDLGFALEYYSSAERRRVEDPALGTYTWSYQYSVLAPSLLGRYSRPAAGMLLFAEGGMGMFQARGSWRASNSSGDIEPPETFASISPGFRVAAGVQRRMGRGALQLAAGYRAAAIGNEEKRSKVYPQPGEVFDVAGDVGAASIHAGYTFWFL